MVITDTTPKVKSVMEQISELTPLELIALLQLITQRLAELFHPFRPQAVQNEKERVLQTLAATGLVVKPVWDMPFPPISDAELAELAQKFTVGRPLSEIIMEEREQGW